MAQQISVTLTDDLDGETAADETIEFAIDGIAYQIDLCQKNADTMRESLHQWVSNARKVSGRTRARRPATTRSRTEDLAPIRAWAKANGMKVSDRGRVSAEIVAAFWERDKARDTTATVKKAATRRVTAAVNKAKAASAPEFSEPTS